MNFPSLSKKTLLVAGVLLLLTVIAVFSVLDHSPTPPEFIKVVYASPLGGLGTDDPPEKHPLLNVTQLLIKTSDNVLSKDPMNTWTKDQLKEHQTGNARQGYIIDAKVGRWYDNKSMKLMIINRTHNYTIQINIPYWGIEWGINEKDPKRFMIVSINSSEFNSSWLEPEYDKEELLTLNKYRLPLDTILTNEELTLLYNIPYGQNVGWSYSKNITNISSLVIYNNFSSLPPQWTPHGSSGNFTICPSQCDYTTLANFETGEDGDINGTGPSIATVNESFIELRTNQLLFNGWTTSDINNSYIELITTANARHNGTWRDDKYRLVSNNSGLNLLVDHINIEGLQIMVNSTADAVFTGISTQNTRNGTRNISNNIILLKDNNGFDKLAGIAVNVNATVWNNIVINATTTCYASSPVSPYNRYVVFYNNFCHSYFDNDVVGVQLTGAPTSGLVLAKNNYIEVSFNDYVPGATTVFDLDSNNNVGNIGGAPGLVNKTCNATFVDEINGDFHLDASDTCAQGFALDLSADANLSFNNDIDGELRNLGEWDAGADQISDNPYINFTAPTPASGTTTASSAIDVNVSSLAMTEQHSVFLDWNYSLYGWWSFDSNNVTDVFDNSTYGRHGNITDAIINSTGVRGEAAHFDGDNDYVLIGKGTDFSNVCVDGCTFAAWIYKKEDILDTIVGRADPTDDNNFFLFDSTGVGTGTIRLEIYSNGTNTDGVTTCTGRSAGNTITLNTWYHVVGTYNETGQNISLYIDGNILDASASPNDGACPFSSIDQTEWKGLEDTFIGVNNDQIIDADWTGIIDEVMIWSRTLEAQEIASLYNAQANQYYNNFTGLADDTYNFTAWAIDENGNVNSTEERSVIVETAPVADTTKPIITIVSPANITYADATLHLNVTANEEVTGWWYSNDTGVTNVSFTPNDTFTWEEGSNLVFIWANDTSDNNGTNNVSFHIDTTSPTINILHPENTTYNHAALDLNATASETVDTWWYSNDTGVTNNTITIDTTITWEEENNFVILYANDSAGNEDDSSIHFRVDTIKPDVNFTLPTPAHGSTITVNNIYINITTNDASEHSVFLDWNYSLYAWYSFDYYNSSDVFDNSTYNRMGNMSGVSIDNLTTGKRGNALIFDGDDTYVTIGKGSDFSDVCLTGCTFSAWINPRETVAGTADTVIGRRDTTDDNRFFYLYKDPDGSINFKIHEDGTATNCVANQSASEITANTWYHIVGIYNLSDTLLYQNGVLQNSTACSFSGLNEAAWKDPENTFIGLHGDDDLQQEWNGTLDEVMVWKRPLNLSEVAALYDATNNKLEVNFTGLPNDIYNFTAHTIDVAGNYNLTETRNITVNVVPPDTTVPLISIDFPTNTTYYQNVTELNYTFIELNPDSCWYSRDNGELNSTSQTCGDNFTNVPSLQGSNNWTVYINDTAGNINWTTVVYFTKTTTTTLNVSFTNTTEMGIFKSVFDEGENFIVWWNWSKENGDSLNDTVGECNFTAYDVVIENKSSFETFTLCTTAACDYQDTIQDNFTMETSNVSESVEKDFVKLEICHSQIAINDIDVIFECEAITDTVTVLSTQFGSCSEGLTRVFAESTACVDYLGVNITLDNTVTGFGARHNISEFELDRLLVNHTEEYSEGETFFNGTAQLWQGNHSYESYEHGQIQIDVNCTHNANVEFSNSTTQNLTIVDRPPEIGTGNMINLNDTFNVTAETTATPNEYEYAKDNWTWIIPIMDDDIDIHNETWVDSTNVAVASVQHSGQESAHNTTNGTFINLNNPYNFTIWANDTSGNRTSRSFYFNVNDTLKPYFDDIEDVTITEAQSLEYDINATDSGTGIQNYAINWTTNFTIDMFNGNLTNISVLAPILYYINVTINDTVGNHNSSIMFVNVTAVVPPDTTAPIVTILSPTNITYNINAIDLNYTFVEANPDIRWYTNNSGVTNITLTDNITGRVWSQGTNAITVYVNDTTGNEGRANVSFFVDSIAPTITYAAQTAVDYANLTQNWIYVNVTITETNLVNVTFYLFNFTARVNTTTYNTKIEEINWTGLNLGNYTYNVTVVDIANNDASAGVRNINLSSVVVDTTAPFLNITNPFNKSYNSNTLDLEYFYIETNPGFAWYSKDNGITNFSIQTLGENWSAVTTVEGNNNWTVYVNDTSGNENSSTVFFFIDSIAPTVEVNANETSIASTFYSINANWTANSTDLDTTVFNVTYPNGTVLYENSTSNGFVILSPVNLTITGIYTVGVWANDTNGNQNATSITFTVSVEAVAPLCMDYGHQIETTPNIDCKVVSFSLNCSTYDLINVTDNSVVIDDGAMTYIAGENYHFVFNQPEGDYLAVFCDNSSKMIKVRSDPVSRLTVSLLRQNSIHILVLLFALALFIIGFIIKDYTFTILSGFVLAVLAIYTGVSGGFEGFRNTFVVMSYVAIIGAIGMYIMLKSAYDWMQDSQE